MGFGASGRSRGSGASRGRRGREEDEEGGGGGGGGKNDEQLKAMEASKSQYKSDEARGGGRSTSVMWRLRCLVVWLCEGIPLCCDGTPLVT